MTTYEWLFIGCQIVTGLLAYREGRKDEEMYWRRAIGGKWGQR